MALLVVFLILGLIFFILGMVAVAVRASRLPSIFIIVVSLVLFLAVTYAISSGYPRGLRTLDANEVYEVAGSFSAGKSQIVALRELGAGEDDFVIYRFSEPQELISKFVVVVVGPEAKRMLKPFPIESPAATQPAPSDKK